MTSTPWRALGIAALLLTCAVAMAEDSKDRQLASQLAEPNSRKRAVAALVASSTTSNIALLLQWTRTPPRGVDQVELDIGLAEAFGELRTEDAIPFLIRNISLQAPPSSPDVWMKTPEVIRGRLPAVAALIRIGPRASRALIQAFSKLRNEDRLAALVVVSQVQGVPEARGFLASVLGQANMERIRAEEGLSGGADVPNYNGQPIHFLDIRKTGQWFDTSPFSPEVTGVFGNSNRRFFHGSRHKQLGLLSPQEHTYHRKNESGIPGRIFQCFQPRAVQRC